MPILGVIASSISGNLTPPDNGSMFPIAMVNVGSAGASYVEFTSIPQTYKHLQIRAMIRGATADTAGQSWIRVNGITTSDYAWHGFYGTGVSSGTENSAFASKDAIYSAFRHPANNAATGLFGAGVCDILDYNSSTKFKTVRTFSGYDANGSGQIRLYSGFQSYNTNPITTLRIQDQSGGGYAQYTQFALYGIKG
jgi:hypothetical protein